MRHCAHVVFGERGALLERLLHRFRLAWRKKDWVSKEERLPALLPFSVQQLVALEVVVFVVGAESHHRDHH
jgi:hypothetical protein